MIFMHRDGAASISGERSSSRGEAGGKKKIREGLYVQQPRQGYPCGDYTF